MKTLKWNGEYWYEDRTPLLARIATWLIWIGGTRTDPTPISVLGHRATLYGWGAQVRLGRDGTLVVRWRRGDRCAYISHNGTPDQAHTWLYGAPRGVREAAAERRGARPAFGNWRREQTEKRVQA